MEISGFFLIPTLDVVVISMYGITMLSEKQKLLHKKYLPDYEEGI